MIRYRLGTGLIAIAVFALTLCASSIASATGEVSTWGVNANQDIYRWTGTTWQQIPGKLTNVSVGSDGTVWGVNNAGTIFRRVGEQWQQVQGGLKQVSVGNAQNVWGVNANQDIWRWTGTGWQQIPGKLTNVAVGSDSTVWGVNNAGNIYRRVGEQWQQVQGGLKQVSVGNAQNVWGVNANQDIWRWNGTGWQQIPGKLANVAVGSDGTVWGVNNAGTIFRRAGEQWQQVQGGLVQVAVAAPQAAPNTVISAPTTVLSAPTTVLSAAPNTTPQNVSTAGGTGALVVSGTVTGALVVSSTGTPVQLQPTTATGTLVTNSNSQILPSTKQPPITVSGSVSGLPDPAKSKSYSTCGGAGQASCGSEPAMLFHAASIDCPAGSFPDLGKSSCWSCPSGFERSPAAVDSDRACQRRDTSVSMQLGKATFRGPLCPEGSFFDPIRGGECYSCPSGYNRSAAHIDKANACFVPAGEKLSAATRHNRGLAWDCKGGTFWDGWDGGNCWSCPAGYKRTANHIKGNNACSAYVAEKTALATVTQRAKCEDGEFLDAKIPGVQNSARGGGCWTCPQAWNRTISPVDGKQACEKTPSFVFARATRVKAMTCEPDEIFDPINANAPAVRSRLDAQNRYLAGIGKQPISVPPVGHGGTCWKCAPGTKRSLFAVYGDEACSSTGMKWVSDTYQHPGLFGLDGAEEVALALVQDGAVINAMVKELATKAQKPVSEVSRAVWQEIATTPQQSDLLKAAVLYDLANALRNPARATPAEVRLLNSVKAEIVRFRTFIAQDAMDAYQAWKDGAWTRQSRYLKSQLQTMVDSGEVPPDFEQITLETIMTGLATGAGAGQVSMMTLMNGSVFKAVFPSAARVAYQSTAPGARVVNAISQKIALELAAEGASRISSGVALQFFGVGPQIIATVAVEMLALAIEQQIDIANAEPKLKAGLATAKITPDLLRMLGTREGTEAFQNAWVMMMSKHGRAPTYFDQFRSLAAIRAN